MRLLTIVFIFLFGVILLSGSHLSAATEFKCPPTEPDSLGPFYEPDAPLRSSVGEGYLLTGTVRSARDCAPIPKAKIELWMANPEGGYDDQHRATVVADQSGAYRFESNRPPDYAFRPPHIHMRITATGFKPLVTQHYPEEGASKIDFNLVLIPEN